MPILTKMQLPNLVPLKTLPFGETFCLASQPYISIKPAETVTKAITTMNLATGVTSILYENHLVIPCDVVIGIKHH